MGFFCLVFFCGGREGGNVLALFFNVSLDSAFQLMHLFDQVGMDFLVLVLFGIFLIQDYFYISLF